MAEKFLVEDSSILVKKESVSHVGILAAIDRGCTLTKILYGTEEDSEHYRLHFALFSNQNFEHAIDFLKQKGLLVLKEGAKLHVTGTGCDIHKEFIREKLGVEILFIDEILTQGRGTHWLIAHGGPDLYYPAAELDKSVVDLFENTFVKMFIEAWKHEVGQPDLSLKFPCLVLFIGSGAGVLKLDEDGSNTMIGGVMLAGRSFLGLANLLLGTSDYSEINRLAEAGNRGNVDSRVKDLFANDPNSPYGQFPEDMPLLPFGRMIDADLKANPASREDVANSLVTSFTINALSAVFMVAKTTKIPRVYAGGNFFRSAVARREAAAQVAAFGGEKYIDLKFLKTGHTGAVGAMLSQPEDVAKFMAHLKGPPKTQADEKA